MKNLSKFILSAALSLVVPQGNSAELTDNYATGDTLTATMMDNIKSAVNDNDARITTNSQSVTTLQTDVGTLQTDTGTLQTDVSTLQSDAGTLQTDVGTLQTDVGTLQSDVGTLQTDVGTLQTDVGILQTEVSDLQRASDSIFFNEFDSRIDFQIPVLDSTNATTTIVVMLANETTTTCDVRTAYTLDSWSLGQNSKSSLIFLPSYIVQTLAGKTLTGSFPVITTVTTIVGRFQNSNVSTSDYVNVSLLRSETSTADTCNVGDVNVRGALVTYPNGTRYYVPVKDMNVD